MQARHTLARSARGRGGARRRVRRRRGAPAHRAQQAPGGPGRDDRVPRVHRAHRLDEPLGRGALEQESGRARLDGAQHVAVGVEGRQDDDADKRRIFFRTG